jgi:hypothetical protein
MLTISGFPPPRCHTKNKIPDVHALIYSYMQPNTNIISP